MIIRDKGILKVFFWGQNCRYPFLKCILSFLLKFIPIRSSCYMTSVSSRWRYRLIIHYGITTVKISSNLVSKAVERAFKCWTWIETSSFYFVTSINVVNKSVKQTTMSCFHLIKFAFKISSLVSKKSQKVQKILSNISLSTASVLQSKGIIHKNFLFFYDTNKCCRDCVFLTLPVHFVWNGL